jgi:hypothetical protein
MLQGSTLGLVLLFAEHVGGDVVLLQGLTNKKYRNENGVRVLKR